MKARNVYSALFFWLALITGGIVMLLLPGNQFDSELLGDSGCDYQVVRSTLTVWNATEIPCSSAVELEMHRAGVGTDIPKAAELLDQWIDFEGPECSGFADPQWKIPGDGAKPFVDVYLEIDC